jgi:hypothetical protein
MLVLGPVGRLASLGHLMNNQTPNLQSSGCGGGSQVEDYVFAHILSPKEKAVGGTTGPALAGPELLYAAALAGDTWTLRPQLILNISHPQIQVKPIPKNFNQGDFTLPSTNFSTPCGRRKLSLLTLQ